MYSAIDQKESQETLYTWIARLGPVKSKVSKVTFAEVTSRSNYDWINKGRFSKKAASLLLRISESVQSHGYYSGCERVENENIELINERPYYQITYSDDDYKILALFHFWSVIEYCYLYWYLIDDWNNTLVEPPPVFLAARNRLEYDVAVLRMLNKVGDSHANIYRSNAAIWSVWGRRYADVDLQFFDNEVVILNVSINDNFYPNVLNGGILKKINGISVKDSIQERLPIAAGPNPSLQMRSFCSNLLRFNEFIISVDVLRDAKRLKFNLSTFTLSSLKSNLKTKTIDAPFKGMTPRIGYLLIANSKKAKYFPYK